MGPIVRSKVVLARGSLAKSIDVVLACNVKIDVFDVVGGRNLDGDVALRGKVLEYLSVRLEIATGQGSQEDGLAASGGDLLGELQEIRFVLVESDAGGLFLVVVAELSLSASQMKLHTKFAYLNCSIDIMARLLSSNILDNLSPVTASAE
jgi:hypothetical protein